MAFQTVLAVFIGRYVSKKKCNRRSSPWNLSLHSPWLLKQCSVQTEEESRRHHGHHEGTRVRNLQPSNRHCTSIWETASLVLLFIREKTNFGSTKVLEVTEIPGDDLRDAMKRRPENPRSINVRCLDARPVHPGFTWKEEITPNRKSTTHHRTEEPEGSLKHHCQY